MVKKRHIITGIATLIILFLTNSLWFNFEPVTVNFNLEGNGNIELGAKLSWFFLHSPVAYNKFNITDNKNISLKIKDVKYFNRLKLTVYNANIVGGG